MKQRHKDNENLLFAIKICYKQWYVTQDFVEEMIKVNKIGLICIHIANFSREKNLVPWDLPRVPMVAIS